MVFFSPPSPLPFLKGETTTGGKWCLVSAHYRLSRQHVLYAGELQFHWLSVQHMSHPWAADMELILNVSVLILAGISCSLAKNEVGDGLYPVKHLSAALTPAFPESVSSIIWFCVIHVETCTWPEFTFFTVEWGGDCNPTVFDDFFLTNATLAELCGVTVR